MSDQRHLRCRLGLHRWTQFKEEDPDLADPGRDAAWVTRCRHCGVERSSGVAFMLGLTGACAVAAALLWALVSPVLGILLAMGAVSGLGLAGRAAWLGSYNRRSAFRFRG